MSCRLWVMLIFTIFQLKSKVMTINHIGDCFYEKRNNTALQGYNNIHDRWLSDFDCFDRCLKFDQPKCRSFEYWHKDQHGLCVRANISLTDYPSITGHSAFVDYYEINCRKDLKAVETSVIHCPSDQLFVTVKSNGIEPNKILLGDSGCKPSWSNETHLQFHTHIDNCSLILTDGFIIGKLRWENVHKDGNTVKYYGRFFACPSNLYQIRAMHHTSTSPNSKNALLMLPNHNQLHHNEQKITSPYRIAIKWKLHNHLYSCPEDCFISLYSSVNITFDDLSLLASTSSIDTCELQALSPYTNYFQSKQLISQGCSVDPIVIDVPKYSSKLSKFHFKFDLYHILKEPIPFQIQCKILHNNENSQIQQNMNCSSFSFIDNNHSDLSSMNKKEYSYTLFRSSSVYVTRQLPSIEDERERFYSQNSFISIATVHYIECSLFALCVLILYAV